MSANCHHCGTNITLYDPLKDHQVIWCHQCIKDNADQLKKLELECFNENEIDRCITTKLFQKFGLSNNVEKLKNIPSKRTTTCDHCDKELNRSHNLTTFAAWCNDCREENIATLKSLDFRTIDGDTVDCERAGNLTLNHAPNVAKIRNIPKKQYDVEFISQTTEKDNSEQGKVIKSEENMSVKLKDLFVGQEIDHPTYGRMIILGNYITTGEKLLGKKEPFAGSTKDPGCNHGETYQYYDKFDGKGGYSTKWVSSDEQVNIFGPRIMKFGLKVGDKVEIFRKSGGTTGLMDVGCFPDTTLERAVGVVVGCNLAGEPNVYIEDLNTLKSSLNTYNPIIIDKSFLDNKSFVEKAGNKSNFWLIRTDKAFNKIEEKNMEDTTTRPAFLDMMKSDATNAAYRVAANQMTKGIKSGILSLMEKNGTGGDKLKAISEMLDTEFGTSLVSILIGLGLTYVPHISSDPRAQRLAGEFRVNGIAIAGNAVFDVAIHHFLPVITGALNALPQETSAIRVAETPRTVEAPKADHAALEAVAHEEAEKAVEQQQMKA